jgi:CRISPR-associated protein Cas1
MRLKDLRILPKVRDSWSYLYVEHCHIDQDQKAIAVHDKRGKVPVPCATLACLLLGPGTSITHAAVLTLADCGCLVVWCGERGVRFYAEGLGETRKSANLLHQATVWSDEQLRLEIVKRMYAMRFKERVPSNLTLQQIRGMEGVRVRDSYRKASEETGVPWRGRNYDPRNWESSDNINAALSTANSCLYGICHAAIVSAGFSPAIGFIHTGKMNSFVFDVADLYKTEITIPVAFEVCHSSSADIARRARLACRDFFQSAQILKAIVPDIEYALGLRQERAKGSGVELSADSGIWDPELGLVPGGINYSDRDMEVGLDDSDDS